MKARNQVQHMLISTGATVMAVVPPAHAANALRKEIRV
jgi:hypothetical protein